MKAGSGDAPSGSGDSRAIPAHLRPELAPDERRAHLERALELFGSSRFYDAHDAWEIVWRSTTPEPRDLLQGLILLTVAFHHLEDRGRPDVAARVLGKAGQRLARFGSGELGIDVPALLEAVRTWRRWCRDPDPAHRPPRLEIPFAERAGYR